MKKQLGAGVLVVAVLAIAWGASASDHAKVSSDVSCTVASRGTRDPSKPIPWIAPRPDTRTRPA